MNVSFTADGRMQVTNLKSKLVAVTANKIAENTFYSALELGLSGEPLSEYISYDRRYGVDSLDISSVSIQYDSLHSTRLSNNSGTWVFDTKSRIPSLQCIRCIPNKKGYRFRNFVTECSKEDSEIVDRLSLDFFKYSNLLSRFEWLRLINGINLVFGQKLGVLDEKAQVISFNKPDSMSIELFDLAKSLFSIMGMCLVSMGSIKKVILLDVDSNKGKDYTDYVFKTIDMISDFDNIAHIIFTAPTVKIGEQGIVTHSYQSIML